MEELNRAHTLTDLYDAAARAVRDLTGFDRVMVYRYDQDYNGEVVAEAKRDDLNSFMGLHYPATDIPAQARALYEKNWLRLISDVDYTPVPLVPTIDPASGTPLDLTHATLRSVSPIHVEYLQNMGVHASMSISLLRRGRLWGLIACHHYAGPHLPPYGSRAAAEFLGSTLSLRLVDQFEDDQLRERLAARRCSVQAHRSHAGRGCHRWRRLCLAGRPCSTWCTPTASSSPSRANTGSGARCHQPDVVATIAAWARGPATTLRAPST